VGQEPVLFKGTIADNISSGKPGASMDEIIAAAKAANAHDFIMQFPDQYNTDLVEGTINLSGGQKQVSPW
jgi:ABC-type multidrug transport system fused ATPase/permease subunit